MGLYSIKNSVYTQYINIQIILIQKKSKLLTFRSLYIFGQNINSHPGRCYSLDSKIDFSF